MFCDFIIGHCLYEEAAGALATGAGRRRILGIRSLRYDQRLDPLDYQVVHYAPNGVFNHIKDTALKRKIVASSSKRKEARNVKTSP